MYGELLDQVRGIGMGMGASYRRRVKPGGAAMEAGWLETEQANKGTQHKANTQGGPTLGLAAPYTTFISWNNKNSLP